MAPAHPAGGRALEAPELDLLGLGAGTRLTEVEALLADKGSAKLLTEL